MRYLIFVIDVPDNRASADEMDHIDAFNEKLQNNGHWIMAAGIQQAHKATSIDNRGNRKSVERNSVFTGSESISGFWIIEAESDQQAEEIAAEASFSCNRRVELRAFLR